MYKRILVAIDGSDISTQILNEAIKLAKDQKAKLCVIYVVDEYFVDYAGVGIDYNQYEAAMRDNGQAILTKVEKKLQQSKVKFESKLVELKTRQGRIEQKIMDEAKAWRANLLVIGTHGRRGLSHFILGSVAEGIVRIATLPVLLVRGKPK